METQQNVKTFRFVVVGVDVAVKNVKVFSVATKMQQSVSVARFTRYKTFRTAVNMWPG
jgi:Tfp pilus assembly PilM family ATPase